MNRFSFFHSAIGLSLAIFFVTGCCSVFTPTDTPEPSPTSAPTDTPEPSPTPTPISIPGIHEPIIVKGDSVQILDAETHESEKSGDSGLRYPDDRSDVFLTLMFSPAIGFDTIDWVALNARFFCGAATYQAESTGLKVGKNGYVESLLLTYVVPGDANFAECILQLPDGEGIPLTSFFD